MSAHKKLMVKSSRTKWIYVNCIHTNFWSMFTSQNISIKLKLCGSLSFNDFEMSILIKTVTSEANVKTKRMDFECYLNDRNSEQIYMKAEKKS